MVELEILKAAMGQVPGLCVLAVLVVYGLRHLRAENEAHRQAMQQIIRRHEEGGTRAQDVITKNTTAMYQMAAAIKENTQATRDLTHVVHNK